MDFLPFTRPTINEETIAKVGEVLRSGWITTGPKAKEFEAAISSFVGNRPVRVVNSATAALKMALQIANIGAGDEVITTPLSWVATANVILEVGATPVFVDVDPITRNINLNQITDAITAKTKAIMPVDLAGLPVDRKRLYDIANKYNLRVIEDAAQSMGANFAGETIGKSGDLISFSFHANKNMTSGEGGCLVMNNEQEAALFEKYRLQGVTRFADGTMDVDLLGGKSNMTDFSAIIGIEQLKQLNDFNSKRRELATHYFTCFNRKLGCNLPVDSSESNWHMFQPLLPLDKMKITRAEFITAMKDKGIGVGVHYPVIHLFSMYRKMGYSEGDFPIAEDIGRRTVTLPLFPAMELADVMRVCETMSDIIIAAKK